MKKLTILFIMTISFGYSQIDNNEYIELLNKSPFNQMYPKFMAKEAADYFDVFNLLFSEKSPIAPKEARLAAIAVSAAIRCEYCIAAQVEFAKKIGASDEEIKAAVQIAAEIQRFSILLYGNEFGKEKLNKIIGRE
tara:strand:- start:1708 stop:2115 length:408 start_codon:yes stop_codon:yes gene_type:complete